MPWRGPETPGEFPTLGYLVADFIEASCAIPDGWDAGQPFLLTKEQLNFILWHYRLRLDAKEHDHPSAAFAYRRSQLVRPQKWGKGPLGAAWLVAEAIGPVLFAGWDANGEPVGRAWPTPWLQTCAVAEDQTANVWTALVPMIELGAINADIPDTGLTRINIAGEKGSYGRIEPATSEANTRLGQRITGALHDQTELWTPRNGGVKLADTQRRNLAGTGGRSIETPNAWDPSEESVAQATYESDANDIFRDYPKPRDGSIRNKRERRVVLKHAYAGAPWVDLDRIEADIEELLPRDPNQAERYFLNRIIAGADKAFDVDLFASRHEPSGSISPGRIITLGFDGAKHFDSTGLVATDMESGYQAVVEKWERPLDLPADMDWTVPVQEVHDAVDFAFNNWDVWRLLGDPPYWQTEMDEWAGRHGEQKVVAWWTNVLKKMAYAIEAWHTAWAADEPVLTHDGDEALVRHVGNSVKRPTKMRDDETGAWLWVIGKEAPKSKRKIDLTMAAILSWKARIDGIAAGALNAPVYRRASWR